MQVKRGRPRKAVCKRGHDISTDDKVYLSIKGGYVARQCRECNLAMAREQTRQRKIARSKAFAAELVERRASTAYSIDVARFHVGDEVRDDHCVFAHRNHGRVVGTNARYGTVQIRRQHDGDVVSIDATMLTMVRKSEAHGCRAASERADGKRRSA